MAQEINSDDYKIKVLKAPGLVVVDFYSTECPPCEALAPKFEHFAALYHDQVKFYKIYRQGNKQLSTDLGVKSSPTLLFYKDGKEVAPRLSGAIKKSEIRSTMIEKFGLPAKNLNSERQISDMDVVIIGAGPAGLSAGLYAARAGLKTLLIDQGNPGGQVNLTHLVANYPGTDEAINGYALMHKMTEQALRNGCQILRSAEITRFDLADKEIDVDDDKRIKAKSIIIALGSKPRSLGLPGEVEYFGKGISYCATCDGRFYEGKDILVIGGGNSAVEESLYLAQFVNSITIIHQFDEFQAEKTSAAALADDPKVKVLWSHEPRAFIGKEGFETLEVENLKSHAKIRIEGKAGIFVFVGYVPQNSIFKGQLSVDGQGYVPADPQTMATELPGVFVAGDIRTKPFRQITTAVSDGTIAALSAQKYLRTL